MPYGANSNEITGAVRASRESNGPGSESGLLRQKNFLCSTVQRLGEQMQDVQCLGKQMQDGFAAEKVQRQEDFASVKKEMKDEMGEGFKNERMARQAQEEMRSEMDIMKEELEKLKRGSGSTVRSEVSTASGSGGSGTFAPPPPSIGTRYQSHFWPRRIEFKGWLEDQKQCSLDGIMMDEIRKFIVDLRKIIPEESQKYIDWDQTNCEQGPWPTKKEHGEYVV